MQLHRPAQPRVLLADKQKEGRLVLKILLVGDSVACQSLCKNALNLLLGRRHIHSIIETMVAGLAAHFIEKCKAFHQRLLQIGKTGNGDIRRLAQTLHIICKARRSNLHCRLRSPCRKHLNREAVVLAKLLMIAQIIRRIIGGAKQGHTGMNNEVSGAHVRRSKLLVAELPHLLRSITVQYTVVVKVTLKLQVAPVIQRISDGLFQSLRPLLEFFPVTGIPCNVAFLHTIGAHLAPFVMIAPQPYLCDILKAAVFGNLFGTDVTVVIQNRHLCRIIVIQNFRGLCLQ